MLSLFTYPHAAPNVWMYLFLWKKRHFKEYFFVHAMKVSEVQNIAFIYLFIYLTPWLKSDNRMYL